MSTGTKPQRRLPNGETMHLLAVPDNVRVHRYIPEEVTAKLKVLQAEYLRIQQEWPPGLRDGITSQIQEGASAFSRLYSMLQDSAAGQFSDNLQRAHDSRVQMRKWQPTYEQTQQLLVEVENERNSIIRDLADELYSSKDSSIRGAGSELSLWLSAVR